MTSSFPLHAPRHVLERPRVAVRVSECCVEDTTEILDLTDIGTTFDERGARLLDIADDKVQTT